MEAQVRMTLIVRHFVTGDLLQQYANLFQELYPRLPCAVVRDQGELALRVPKLLLLGTETYVDVDGVWKNVKEIS